MEEMINKIVEGDCLEVMGKLPDNSIDLILTDPPYEYGKFGKINVTYMQGKKFNTGLDDIKDGFNIDVVFAEFQRLCKKFNLFCFCSNKQISSIMTWGEDKGYSTTLLIWNKQNPAPLCNNVWRQDIEFIVHIKEKGAVFKGDAKIKRKVWTSPIVYFDWHPTSKPVELLSKYIKIGSNEGDLILDPYAGSSSTAVACQNLNRKFICIEKEKEYVEKSRKRVYRLMSAKSGLAKFTRV